MRIALSAGLVMSLVLAAPSGTANAQETAPAATAVEPWTQEELENLLAPIALYPDPVLAQVLIAATFPEQIALAAAYVRAHGTKGLDTQPWEISVKAVAHYPPVLNLMAEGEDWTIALGQAYAEQSNDVMDAVQSLRRMANAQGNLVTTSQQQVIVEREVIKIVPAEPRVVYVPTYDPAVVYFRPIYIAHAHPAHWSWGVGFPIGVWLTYDFDWYAHRVFYHGWHGHGWIVASRPWVIISPIYVAPRHTVIVINRRIVHRTYNPRHLDRYRYVHRHTTFDRGRGVGRDVARRDNDRDRNYGRDGNRNGGRNDGRGYDGGNDRTGGRDVGRDAGRTGGRDQAGETRRRTTPVPTRPSRPQPTTVARRSILPDRPDWVGRDRATPTPERPTPTSPTRISPTRTSPTPTRTERPTAGRPTATPRATPSAGRATVPEAVRRIRDAKPAASPSRSSDRTPSASPPRTNGRAPSASPPRTSGRAPSASPRRSGGGSGASAPRSGGGSGRSSAPRSGGRSRN